MSKVQFEEFLACQFCEYISETVTVDTKFHYSSANSDQAEQLYLGFKSLGFEQMSVKGVTVNYITYQDQRLLIIGAGLDK